MATQIFLMICIASEGFLIFVLVRFVSEAKKSRRAFHVPRATESEIRPIRRKHIQMQAAGRGLKSDHGSAAAKPERAKIASIGGTGRA